MGFYVIQRDTAYRSRSTLHQVLHISAPEQRMFQRKFAVILVRGRAHKLVNVVLLLLHDAAEILFSKIRSQQYIFDDGIKIPGKINRYLEGKRGDLLVHRDKINSRPRMQAVLDVCIAHTACPTLCHQRSRCIGQSFLICGIND